MTYGDEKSRIEFYVRKIRELGEQTEKAAQREPGDSTTKELIIWGDLQQKDLKLIRNRLQYLADEMEKDLLQPLDFGQADIDRLKGGKRRAG